MEMNQTTPQAKLEVLLLGGFEAHLATGQRLCISSRKSQGLLAFLAMNPHRAHSREALATLLWERSGPDQARVSLRQALRLLRKALLPVGTEIIVANRDQVSLIPGTVEVDAEELAFDVKQGSRTALERASALFRGNFLEGFTVVSEPFEEWLMGERRRLHGLAETAAERLLTEYRRTGDREHAIRAAVRLVDLDPLREDAQRRLMRLYAESNHCAQALKQYETLRELLRRELGLEPDAETRQLAEQLRREHSLSAASEPATTIQPYDGTGAEQPAAEQPVAEPAEGGFPALGASAETPVYQSDRRFLTLLSCSLVDAAGLAASLDPEDLAKVISGFSDFCEEVVNRHSGHVCPQMDYSITGCFGYPEADEHEAEHAVRAALDILSSIGELTFIDEVRLQTRISIASGRVVVSKHSLSKGGSQETIVGDTPPLVARLRAMSQPNTLLISENTKALLGALFEYEDLGLQVLDGFLAPVRVWRVLGERPGQSRFAATRVSTARTPLVGREEEIELFKRRWEQARTGSGQVVVLAGEPGIGKSRLSETVRERLTGGTFLYIGYYCSPHHRESVLYPVIQQLERAAGYGSEDPPAAKLEKLEALLAQTADDLSAAVPLIADLLSIPTRNLYPPLNLTPQRQKERTLETLEAQLVGLARQQRILMIFEDLQWSDPTTREFLGRLIERVQTLPVLLIVTHRPGTAIPWTGEPQVTSLVLKRLLRSESEALAATLTGKVSLPTEVLAQIVEKADGVPLFIEELTRNVLEVGLPDKRGEHYTPDRLAQTRISVPNTLHDLLLARFARLGPAKAVAQEAAVIGRHFSYKLLAATSTLNGQGLQDALARLVDAGLVYSRGTPPHATYSFKHALIRDAAYDSLLRADRAVLHERIAKELEERYPETAEVEPEVLARHFVGAGLDAQAAFYSQKAGELAMRRWAHREAIAYFERALKSLKTLPHSAERSAQELALQLLLGQAWMLTAGYTAPEVEAAYARARDLCDETDDPYQLFFVLLGMWQLYIARQDLAPASEIAEQLLPLALSQHNQDFAIEAHVAQLVTAYTLGAFETTLAHANEAIALDDPDAQHGRIQSFGYDGRVIALTGAAWALWILGYPEQALHRVEEALATARSLAHPYTQTMALYSSAWLHLFCRDARVARELSEQSIALSIEHGFPWPRAYAAPVAGWAQAEEGSAAEGIETAREGLAALEQMGHSLWRPHQQGLLASAYARAGRIDEALTVIGQALDMVTRTGEQENASELNRLKGELTLRRAAPGAALEAEECFKWAIQIARHQNAKSWELRAATSLARLWHSQQRQTEARELLLPVYEWFTEGLETPDLQAARELLETLDESDVKDGNPPS